jgi:hypothetical protein
MKGFHTQSLNDAFEHPKYRRSEIPSKSTRQLSTTQKCGFPSSTDMNDMLREDNPERWIFRTCAGIRMDLNDEDFDGVIRVISFLPLSAPHSLLWLSVTLGGTPATKNAEAHISIPLEVPQNITVHVLYLPG